MQTETAGIQVYLLFLQEQIKGIIIDSAAWVDATRDVVGGTESKWKEMHPSQQRVMTGADTRAGAATAARSRVLATPRVPRMPLHLRGLLF